MCRNQENCKCVRLEMLCTRSLSQLLNALNATFGDFKSCLLIENRVHSTWNPLSDLGGTWQLFRLCSCCNQTINRYQSFYFRKAPESWYYTIHTLSTKLESFLIFCCHRLVTCSASHSIKRVKRLIGFVRARENRYLQLFLSKEKSF